MCIKTSYDYLKTEATKKCFLLCALFPEDHSIDVEDLVRYAWGLGLYGKARSVKSLRTEVSEAINFLIDSCLLLKDGRCVKQHDIVRDVALWIASVKENSFMMKTRLEELLNESSESYEAISLLSNEEKEFPKTLEHSKLEILLLENCDVHGTCLREMKELKVLSLSIPCDSPRIFSFYGLTSLQKLSALHLENFEGFSFLGNLETLQILSLRGSGLEGLGNELGKLKNLKILDLTECEFSLRFPPNVILMLSKLEELYLKGSNIEEVVDDILGQISFLHELTVLSLKVSSFVFRENCKLPGKLERYDILAQDRFGSFHITEKSLKIEGVIPLNVFSLFTKSLETLEVSNNNLSRISELSTQHVRLEGLVKRRIQACSSLISLFPLSLAQRLVHLEILEISDCLGLKHIVAESESDEEGISLSINSDHHDSLCFPKLRRLDIRDCDELEYIFPTSMAPQGLQGLTLTIWHCRQLKQVIRMTADHRVKNDNIVLQQQLQSLRSLKELALSDCPQLIDSVVQLEAEEAYIRLLSFILLF